MFTLLPLITGEDRARHGKILAQAAALAESGKLRPILYAQRFSVADIEVAHAVVEKGSLGKVVVELWCLGCRSSRNSRAGLKPGAG